VIDLRHVEIPSDNEVLGRTKGQCRGWNLKSALDITSPAKVKASAVDLAFADWAASPQTNAKSKTALES
jgi:hypothetical protein